MKNIVIELWKNETLPVKDAIYFSNGAAFLLEITSYPIPTLQKGNSFDLNELYKNNENEITHIDIFKEIKLSNGFFCCVGEASYGTEGFIACLDTNKNLIWVIYSETSNPFINIIEYRTGNILVESSANFKLRIDVIDPMNIELVKES